MKEKIQNRKKIENSTIFNKLQHFCKLTRIIDKKHETKNTKLTNLV